MGNLILFNGPFGEIKTFPLIFSLTTDCCIGTGCKATPTFTIYSQCGPSLLAYTVYSPFPRSQLICLFINFNCRHLSIFVDGEFILSMLSSQKDKKRKFVTSPMTWVGKESGYSQCKQFLQRTYFIANNLQC